MNLRRAALALTLGWIAQVANAQIVGELLPPHAAGELEIHHINTGEGNAAFFILPDSTTLLIDCGDGTDSIRPEKYKAPRRPNDSHTPGEWVARYIQKFHPDGAAGMLDYLLVSHFHGDHMAGIPDLARHVGIRKVVDRAWPDYQKATPFTGKLAERYHAALKEQSERHGTKMEQFKPGAADQIVLRKDPSRYPTFAVQNIASNGEVWTGAGTDRRARMPAGQAPNENCSSIALRMRYGRFDYFTGGDIPGVPGGDTVQRLPLRAARKRTPEWIDMESPVAWVTGPVDVTVLNHHGFPDTTNSFFLSVLQPRVCIVQVWASSHLAEDVLGRIRSETIYPGPRDIFTTNGVWDGRLEHLIRMYGEERAVPHVENLQKLAGTQGHVVVRVAPGGDSYRIFVLDDSQETQKILSIHGYESR